MSYSKKGYRGYSFVVLIVLIYQIVTVSGDIEAVGQGFVESPLPPLVEVVAVPSQTVGCESVATEIEDADLLAFRGVEGAIAEGWDEKTVVREHRSLDTHLPIVTHQQADIAEGMVLAQPRGTKVGYMVPTL